MDDRLTVSNLSARLGLTDKAVRIRLRALASAGDPLVDDHQYGKSWTFTAAELDALVSRLQGERTPVHAITPVTGFASRMETRGVAEPGLVHRLPWLDSGPSGRLIVVQGMGADAKRVLDEVAVTRGHGVSLPATERRRR